MKIYTADRLPTFSLAVTLCARVPAAETTPTIAEQWYFLHHWQMPSCTRTLFCPTFKADAQIYVPGKQFGWRFSTTEQKLKWNELFYKHSQHLSSLPPVLLKATLPRGQAAARRVSQPSKPRGAGSAHRAAAPIPPLWTHSPSPQLCPVRRGIASRVPEINISDKCRVPSWNINEKITTSRLYVWPCK